MVEKAKGITPVVAIVLLLLVTVGAVGVVYAQFQEISGQDTTAGYLESVDVNLISVNRNSTYTGKVDRMQLRFGNTMDEAFNASESLRLEYSIPGESRIEPTYTADEQLFGQFDVAPSNMTCPTNVSAELFSPGATARCNTGVQMPGPTEELTVHMVEVGTGEVADEYTCSPSTVDSTTC